MRKTWIGLVMLLLLIVALAGFHATASPPESKDQTSSSHEATAIFAGGCFWCTEADFEKREGVIEAVSGFTGGDKKDPDYNQVASGRTRHVEAVQVTYDPSKVTYRELLEHFWRHVDPTDAGGQFVDRGSQYRPLIFYQKFPTGDIRSQ